MKAQSLNDTPNSFVVSKQTVFLSLLFVLPVFSDALLGMAEAFSFVLPFSLGVLLRGAALLLFFGLLLKHVQAANPLYLIWLAAIFLSVLPSLFLGSIRGGSFSFDVIEIIKSVFLPIVAAGLALLCQRSRHGVSALLTAIEMTAYLYTFFIVVPEMLGIGLSTYGEYADGGSGFFTAGNDASVTLGLSLIVVAYRLAFARFSMLRIAMFVAGMYACTLIGTRAALIFAAGATVAFSFAILFMRPPRGSRSAFRKMGKLVLSGGLVVVISTFAMNGLSQQLTNRFQAQKLDELAQGVLPRHDLMLSGIAHIQARPAIFIITGEGSDLFQQGVARSWPGRTRRQVEVDWIDALGAHGIAFTVITHFLVIIFLLKSAKAFVVSRDPLFFFVSFGLFLFLAHSALAGHALYAPAPASVGAGFLALAMTQHSLKRTRP